MAVVGFLTNSSGFECSLTTLSQSSVTKMNSENFKLSNTRPANNGFSVCNNSSLKRSVTLVNFSDEFTTCHTVNCGEFARNSDVPSMRTKPLRSILKKSNSFVNLNKAEETKIERNGLLVNAFTKNFLVPSTAASVKKSPTNNKKPGHQRSYIDPVYLSSSKAPVVSNEMDKVVSQSDRLKYKVAVTTGPQKDAKTSARVFITLKGQLGDLPRRHLTKKECTNIEKPFSFNPSTTNAFIFEARDIGDVVSVVVEHDGVNEEDSWFLKKVKVSKSPTANRATTAIKNSHNSSKHNRDSNIFIFPCNNWLSLFKGDKLKKRHLYSKHTLNTSSQASSCVRTGSLERRTRRLYAITPFKMLRKI
ncbi:hypothetical protein HELRODRAFT_165231 [Helobdella robusta]|uniref:PLAT domain-containing protein n=1 Tax=Helobdella robusta TaxID=6412 RepID=T1EWH0_HELRO|nr:hypothetical protein HELRODRAFT_165231 [Helobdella robusta]ESN93072.1 hypothetical protein HELRODRAFT_165231 [Helobdella robusta]